MEDELAYWNARLQSEGLGERIYKKQIRGARGTPDRARARQREVVIDSHELAWVYDTKALPDPTRAPESAIQALMEAEPHQDPAGDKEAAQALREALLDAMEDILGYDAADLLCRRYFGQASMAELSAETGIAASTISERIQASLILLRSHLEDASPAIKEYLQ